jgi:nuclear migration protein NUM1
VYKVVEVPVEKRVEVEVEKIVYVDRPVEVEVIREVVREVEVPVHVVKEVIREVGGDEVDGWLFRHAEETMVQGVRGVEIVCCSHARMNARTRSHNDTCTHAHACT